MISIGKVIVDGADAGGLVDVIKNNPSRTAEIKAAVKAWHDKLSIAQDAGRTLVKGIQDVNQNDSLTNEQKLDAIKLLMQEAKVVLNATRREELLKRRQAIDEEIATTEP